MTSSEHRTRHLPAPLGLAAGLLLVVTALSLVGCSLFPGLGHLVRPTIAPPTLDLVNLAPESRAVILALSADPVFTSAAVSESGGITAYDEQAIGQANWYQVSYGLNTGEILVTVRLGFGDCPAGCISEHRWVYSIVGAKLSGPVESGDPLPSPAPGLQGAAELHVRAQAGPTCPVERVPPDPACAPRPVADVLITATPLAGDAVTSHTGPDGTASLSLPAGVYLISGEAPSVGLPDSGARSVVVAVGPSGSANIIFSFDTGIR